MTVVFDTYVPGSSLLHRLDPRIKLWSTLLACLMVFLLPAIHYTALFLIITHLVLIASGVPWTLLIRVWRQMAILSLLILVMQTFAQSEGAILISLGPLHATAGGLERGLGLALRALCLAFVTSGLLFTTQHPQLVQGLVALGLPYSWGLTVSLALRFLPAIQNLFHAVRDAQAARGWTPQGSIFRQLRMYLPILIAVIIGTLRLSDQLTLALAARGFIPGRKRSCWRELHLHAQDRIFGISFTLGFLIVVWLSATVLRP